MGFIAHWHRKVAPTQVRVATQPSSFAAISGRHSGRLPADAPFEPALDAAIQGLRGVMAHVASADALTGLGNDVRALARP